MGEVRHRRNGLGLVSITAESQAASWLVSSDRIDVVDTHLRAMVHADLLRTYLSGTAKGTSTSLYKFVAGRSEEASCPYAWH